MINAFVTQTGVSSLCRGVLDVFHLTLQSIPQKLEDSFLYPNNPICQCINCLNKVKSNKCTASVREYWNWRRNSKLEFLGKLNFVPLNSSYISIICQIEFSWLSSFVLLFFFFSISRVLFSSKPPGSRHAACDCLAGFCFRVKTILEI